MTAHPEKLNAFPVFMRVEGRIVLIVGNGEEALAKARLLSQSSARITIVADAAEPDLARFVAETHATLIAEPYDPAHLDGAVLVFAATGEEALDRRIVTDARHRHIAANAVDRPDLCDFFTPALVNRAPLSIAIGTEGTGPVLAQMVRARIDAMLPPSLGALAVLARSLRSAAEHAIARGNPRRAFWQGFFSGAPARAMAEGDADGATRAAHDLLARSAAGPVGHVALVGAGPGAEDLLTLRAHRLLMEADVVVYDALVPDAVVAMGRRDAERIGVGKRKGCHSKSQSEINDLLVELGREGKRVVRLKSGDPLVFGRAGEEMQALRDAGIGFEIVPGVTAAFAAAADFGLPLTLRGVSSSMVFTTGHDLKGGTLPDWAKLAISGRDRRRLHGPLGRRRRRRTPDRRRPVAGHGGRRRRECQPARPPPLPRHAGRPALAAGPERSGRPGHDHHRRRGRRRRFLALDAAVGLRAGPSHAGVTGMKVLTANRLTDGEAVWLATNSGWVETIDGAEVVQDKAGEDRLEAAGKQALANDLVVDVNLIDVALTDGAITPTRLRERIRAAGPTNRPDLGKQARPRPADEDYAAGI